MSTRSAIVLVAVLVRASLVRQNREVAEIWNHRDDLGFENSSAHRSTPAPEPTPDRL